MPAILQRKRQEQSSRSYNVVLVDPLTLATSIASPTSSDDKCDSCDESFADRSSLIIHKTEQSILRTRAALREPIVQYACELCQLGFASKGLLERHRKNCGVLELDVQPTSKRQPRLPAETDGPVACDKCDKVFKKAKYLKVHVTMAHGAPVSCQLCEAQLESSARLKSHMAEAHGDELSEICHLCGKGFQQRQSLKVHLAAHERDERPCVCRLCGKSFRHEVYLRKHVQLVHVELRDPKKYSCEICGYATPYKTCLREHSYKHTGENQVECEVCGKAMRRAYLKTHARIHTGEKPEICEYCGKAFSARKYLTKHRLTHTGEKPYRCDICGKSYTQRGTLTCHFKSKHPGAILGTAKRSKLGLEAADDDTDDDADADEESDQDMEVEVLEEKLEEELEEELKLEAETDFKLEVVQGCFDDYYAENDEHT